MDQRTPASNHAVASIRLWHILASSLEERFTCFCAYASVLPPPWLCCYLQKILWAQIYWSTSTKVKSQLPCKVFFSYLHISFGYSFLFIRSVMIILNSLVLYYINEFSLTFRDICLTFFAFHVFIWIYPQVDSSYILGEVMMSILFRGHLYK